MGVERTAGAWGLFACGRRGARTCRGVLWMALWSAAACGSEPDKGVDTREVRNTVTEEDAGKLGGEFRDIQPLDFGIKGGKDAGLDAAMDGPGGGPGDGPGPNSGPNDGPGPSGPDGGPSPASDTDAGAKTDAGSDVEPPSATVHGRIIDYLRNPVAGVSVSIGSSTAMTDDEGAFEIEAVANSYDVVFSVRVAHYGATEVSSWRFEGLTRRDPTLQIYRGNPLRSGNVTYQVDNVTFPLPNDQEIHGGLGGQYMTTATEFSYARIQTSASWEGPTAVQGVGHALHVVYSSSPALPLRYLASDHTPIALSSSSSSTVTFDLGNSGGPLMTDLVEGKVAQRNFADVRNYAYLRFDDDAVIELLEQYSAPDDFSYVTPLLSDAKVVVAVTGEGPGYAAAYSDRVTPGTRDLALSLPTPAVQVSPAAGASEVDGETMFSWNGPEQVYMLRAISVDYYESINVVTSKKQTRLPVPPEGDLALIGGGAYRWSVRTHNHHETVDEATGPEGQLDAFCWGTLEGPVDGPGTHTSSGERGFIATATP